MKRNFKNIFSISIPIFLSLLFLNSVVSAEAQQVKRIKPVRPVFKLLKVKATVIVSDSNYSGSCPHRFIFKGKITANGAGTVKYKWIRSDGAQSQEKTLIFRKAGERTISSYWQLGTSGRNYRRLWKAIKVTSPVSLTSNRASFNLNCIPEVRYVSNRISGNINGGSDGNLIRSRGVRVILKRGGSTVSSRILTLNSGGSADYTFSGPYLTYGTYTIRVEKITSSPDNPNTLNVCFNGTDPVLRTVIIDSAHRVISNQDFVIDFSIAWDRHGFCW
ncbi:MAG: hypothetical protein ABFR75_06640 [Acidobacteriota bacterium]